MAVLPNILTSINTNGSDYITSYASRNIDYSLERLSIEYLNGENASISLKVEDGKLKMDETKSFAHASDKKEVILKDNEKFYYIEISQVEKVTLVVGYVSLTENYESIAEKMDYIQKQLLANYKTSAETTKDGYDTATVHNTLLFSEEQFRLSISQANTTSLYKVNDGVVSTKEVLSYTSLVGVYDEIESEYSDLTSFYSSNKSHLLNRWSKFFDQAYAPLKIQALLVNVFVFAALDLFVVLAMIITLLIMSRFKTSVCEKLSFATSLKYVAFAALCPGILSFVIYYIIPGMQSMAFFTFLAMRSIFFVTKLTRGFAEAQN